MKKFLLSVLFALGLLFSTDKAFALETPYLSAKYLGGDSVQLWWSEVPDASYQVYYGPKDNPMAHGVTLGQGESYTVHALFRNTSYVFAVKAIRGSDVSSMSNWVWVSTGVAARRPLPNHPPVAMMKPAEQKPMTVKPMHEKMALGADYMGWDKVRLHWTPVANAHYELWYGPKDNPRAYRVVLGQGTDYTVEQLYKNTTYVFRVSAVHDNGHVATVSNVAWKWVGHTGRVDHPMMTHRGY